MDEPLYPFRERVRRFFESIPRKLAWKLPANVVMWATLRAVAHSTTGDYTAQNVTDLSAMTAVARWNDDKVSRK